MSAPFVPLSVPASGRVAERAAGRLTILSQSETTQAFKPFTPATAAAARLADRPHAGHAGAPKITLLREGERVTQIRVECACGEVVELACVY